MIASTITSTSTAKTTRVSLFTTGTYNGHEVRVETDQEDWSELLHCEDIGHDLEPIRDEDGHLTDWLMCYRCWGLADNPEFQGYGDQYEGQGQ